MKYIMLASLFFISSIAVAYPQEKKVVKDYIKEDGWEIPGLNSLTNAEILKQNPYKAVIKYNPKDETFLKQWFFLPDKERERIELKTESDCHCVEKWWVQQVIKYEACGKVFCYKVFFVPFFFQHNGLSGSIASVYIISYYDDNGDGLFERLTRESFTFSEPSWICSDFDKD